MKNKHYFPQVSLLICILCCFPHLIHAYSLRQFSNKNGLSNSAILSLYQDHQGVIWIGSCDGLNIFDGTNIHVYNPVNPTKAPLSGNLINDIMETERMYYGYRPTMDWTVWILNSRHPKALRSSKTRTIWQKAGIMTFSL